MKRAGCLCEDCGEDRRPLFFCRVPAPRFYGMTDVPRLGRLLCAECAGLYVKPVKVFDQVKP